MSESARKVRQRISTACLGCREKKSKCDGNPAGCSACNYRKQGCVYHYTENKRKPPSKNYVKALEAKIAHLERELSIAKLGSVEQHESILSGEFIQFEDAATVSASYVSVDSDTSANPIDEITKTIGKFQIADGGEVRYFGSRSNFNLLQTAMLSKKSSREIQLEGFRAAMVQMEPLEIADELHIHLLDLYWKWQNPWQCFVSRRLFTASLNEFGAHNFGPFHSPLLLTAIYALASRYSDRVELRKDPTDPNTAGDQFVDRVRIMLQYECEAPTTTTVQAVLLLSLCETARDKEALGFLYCGMAARMALNLGLHVDCSKCVDDGLLTVEKVEDRQITWWGVYMLDKLFNIGLGRPSMIQERDITAKMPSCDSADEWITWDTDSDGPDQQSCRSLSLSAFTRQMFAGVTEVLDSIYSPHKSLSSAARETLASSAQVRLVRFLSSLPDHLKLPRSPSLGESPVLPHVYQMHMQYHVVTILLHRPFLKTTRLFDGGILSGIQDENSHSEACRSSAESIANILRWQHKSYGLRTAPISTVHCAFTAAVIFLVDASTTLQPTRDKATKNLTLCIEGLEELQTAWSWSSRSLLALRNIAEAWEIPVPAFSKERYRLPSPFQNSQTQDLLLNSASISDMLPLNDVGWFPEADEFYDSGLLETIDFLPFA